MDMAAETGQFKQTINRYLLQTAAGNRIPYGVGCAWLGRGAMDTATMDSEAAVLRLAYDSGVRYFDTSVAYGESERIVGHFLAQVPRESLFLASKVRVREDVTVKEAAALAKLSLEQSLLRLRTEYIDLFQVHDPNVLTNVLAEGGVLHMLLEAKERGVIRNIGLATRQHELLAIAANHGQFDTILTYSDYTPVDPSASSLIAEASGLKRGVINASPLLTGLLCGLPPMEVDIPRGVPELELRQRWASELYDLCAANGVSITDAALQFPVRQPQIDITLSGPSIAADVTNTIASLERPIPESFWQQVGQWYDQLPQE
ncbi:aldo/keto reductase [Paenibacillus sp. OV219]|uniref:aldo/keto reductase n=1 Tax=Paenibacillus sp. OV219 TaxID=1884377 RepID=UPI0008B21C47|nr:aldo/keto reductase [Paenibacillus sp. OV219]SEN80312.1 Predicted oxidoreductase [Paenibacillus sp. OV219]